MKEIKAQEKLMCSYKIRTGLSEFIEILVIYTSSKFTSKVLYIVSSLPRINKKNICVFLCIYSFLPVFHINRPEEGGGKRAHTNKMVEHCAIL